MSRRPAVEPHYAKSGLDGAFNLVRSRIPAKTSLRGSRPAAEPAVHVQTKSDGEIGRARKGWATHPAARLPRSSLPPRNEPHVDQAITHVLKLRRTPIARRRTLTVRNELQETQSRSSSSLISKWTVRVPKTRSNTIAWIQARRIDCFAEWLSFCTMHMHVYIPTHVRAWPRNSCGPVTADACPYSCPSPFPARPDMVSFRIRSATAKLSSPTRVSPLANDSCRDGGRLSAVACNTPTDT